MKNIKDFYNDTAEKWDEDWDNNDIMSPYFKNLGNILMKDQEY